MSPHKKETSEQLKSRSGKILRRLRKNFPMPKTALNFSNPLQLLIGTILSAQCTDKQVNIVTRDLFKKYRTVRDYARAPLSGLEQDIRSTGFYKNKAKNIIACCKMLLEKHDGIVPRSMDELIELPGVGRKTANCVLGAAYGINEGVVVDTHVLRLSERLGLSHNETPEKVELDLMQIVPQQDWYDFSNVLISHGRAVCNARKPNCPACSLLRYCPSAEKFMMKFWKE